MTVCEELLPLTSQLYGLVLDAGCGNGEYSRLLGTLSSVRKVLSLDIKHEPFAYGRCYRDNCPDGIFYQGDVQDLRAFADDFFDCTLAWHVIEHCQQPTRALHELRRVTHGLVMLALPRRGYGPWDSSEHV